MADQPNDETIFGNDDQNKDTSTAENTPVTQQESQPSNNGGNDAPSNQPQFNIPDELKDWIGEGKKYRDLETALKSIPHAQQHIDQLQTDLNEYKSKAEQAKTLEDFVAEINKERGGESETPSETSLRPEDVQELVRKQLEASKTEERQQANRKSVADSLLETHGEKAKEFYVKRAEELGMPVKELNSLCDNAPKAALALLGVNGQQSKPSTTPSYRTEGLETQSKSEKKGQSVMGSSSIKTDLEAWRRIGEKVKENYGG